MRKGKQDLKKKSISALDSELGGANSSFLISKLPGVNPYWLCA